MKKPILSALMILLLISFAFAKASVQPITPDDLPYLPGEWAGSSLRGQRIDLRIYNDSLPIRGEITLYASDNEPQACSFTNGYLKNGQLIFSCEELVITLYLRLQEDNEELQLAGDVELLGASGKVVFEKVGY
jgi:hypothetical protein